MLLQGYKIDNSKRTNISLIDCDLLAKVYINLIDQKEPTLDLKDQIDSINKEIISNNFFYKKIIQPNSDEIKKHNEYLKNHLKKNYF